MSDKGRLRGSQWWCNFASGLFCVVVCRGRCRAGDDRDGVFAVVFGEEVLRAAGTARCGDGGERSGGFGQEVVGGCEDAVVVDDGDVGA